MFGFGIMARFTSLSISAIVCMVSYVHTLPYEPVCSKFDYEMKTMEAMLRTEQNVLNMVQEMKVMQDSVSKSLDEMKELKIKMTSDFDALAKTVDRRVLDQSSQISGELELVTKKANNKIQEIDASLQQLVPKDLNVAFTVTKPTKALVKGVPIFSITRTNVGEAYNMDTGVFNSPVDGLYMFVFTVSSEGKHQVVCYIKHNSSLKVFGRTSSDNSHTTASVSVFLILTKGDTVTLGSCHGWAQVYTHSDTTFSGALIKQTSKM